MFKHFHKPPAPTEQIQQSTTLHPAYTVDNNEFINSLSETMQEFLKQRLKKLLELGASKLVIDYVLNDLKYQADRISETSQQRNELMEERPELERKNYAMRMEIDKLRSLAATQSQLANPMSGGAASRVSAPYY